jgi:hypothetical protein
LKELLEILQQVEAQAVKAEEFAQLFQSHQVKFCRSWWAAAVVPVMDTTVVAVVQVEGAAHQIFAVQHLVLHHHALTHLHVQ